MSQKITEEQLKNLQEKVGMINQAQAQIGGLEVQKHQLLHQVGQVQGELQEFQKELEEQYGKVSINIQDGTYEPIEEDVPVHELSKED
jgi:predicted nuclease with TOPRIM domain